jgi:phosphomannomutase
VGTVEERRAVHSRVDSTILKSYDVRGVYPSELNEDVAYAIGPVLRSPLNPGPRQGEALSKAFARGAEETGADIVDAMRRGARGEAVE